MSKTVLKIAILIGILFLFSCNNGFKTRETKYSNGHTFRIEYFDTKNNIIKAEEFFITGQKKELYNFNPLNGITTTVSYNPKGEKISESTFKIVDKNNCIQTKTVDNTTLTYKGKVNSNGVKIGWWSVFDENNILKGKNEYLIINKERYLNQIIQYTPDGKINNNTSHYFNLTIPDTIPLGRSAWDFSYNPWFNEKSQVSICIGYAINKDFNNIKKVEIDTFKMLNPKKGWFGLRYESSGKKIIRGFIYEKNIIIKDNSNIKKNTALETIKQTKSYFEKEVYVKNK